MKLHFGITETVEQLTVAKHMGKELLRNEDLRLKVVMVLRVVNVVVVLVLVVMCILQDHVVEKQHLTGKAAVSYVEEAAIPSVGVNGPW